MNKRKSFHTLSQGKYNLQRCFDGLVGDQRGVVPGFQLQVFP